MKNFSKIFFWLIGIILLVIFWFLSVARVANKNDWPAEQLPSLSLEEKTDTEEPTTVDKSQDDKMEGEIKTASPVAPLFVDWPVAFTSQAPRGDWADKRQQDGCEEAAVLMAVTWAKGEVLASAKDTEKVLIDLADWQIQQYGSAADTNATDTAERLLKTYFKYDQWRVASLVAKNDIIKELRAGHIVLVPTNGQKLGNPFYKQPGPLTHMLVIKGYDETSDEFITNDPGTKRGAGYRYKTKTIIDAAWDYATGDHEAGDTDKKSFIAVYKYGQEK